MPCFRNTKEGLSSSPEGEEAFLKDKTSKPKPKGLAGVKQAKLGVKKQNTESSYGSKEACEVYVEFKK